MKKSICTNCTKEFNYRSQCSTGKYCSNKCQREYQSNQSLQKWLNGTWDGTKKGFSLSSTIRRYLLEQTNHKCSSCGWCEINPSTGKSPLEIDHINGDSENNRPENLRVLCPNCHSLTPTYKALNYGKGNKARLKYHKLI
jgi:5-methylcytosine-specific restriction endonuclease McrA